MPRDGQNPYGGTIPTRSQPSRPRRFCAPLQGESSVAAPFRSHSVGPQGSGPAPSGRASFTDTQVLKILEARRASVHDDVDESNCDQIALLRPDDTGTRQALKEAVRRVHRFPLPCSSTGRRSRSTSATCRPLAIFKAHTLYATESRRKGRSCYFLRLGFFADPISAKQVAVQVRSTFPSAAVVPVLESEVARAREPGRDTSAIAYLDEPQVARSWKRATHQRHHAQAKPRAMTRDARPRPLRRFSGDRRSRPNRKCGLRRTR